MHFKNYFKQVKTKDHLFKCDGEEDSSSFTMLWDVIHSCSEAQERDLPAWSDMKWWQRTGCLCSCDEHWISCGGLCSSRWTSLKAESGETPVLVLPSLCPCGSSHAPPWRYNRTVLCALARGKWSPNKGTVAIKRIFFLYLGLRDTYL